MENSEGNIFDNKNKKNFSSNELHIDGQISLNNYQRELVSNNDQIQYIGPQGIEFDDFNNNFREQ